MKTAAYVLPMLIAVTVFSVTCNDTNMITDTQPELAAISTESNPLDVTFKLNEQTGEGPEITRLAKPMLWDGVSKMESGAVYYFRNEEEKLAAYATVPAVLNMYNKLLLEREIGKVKEAISTETAGYCDCDAYSFISWFNIEDSLFGQAIIKNGQGDVGYVYHWWAIENYSGLNIYHDGAAHKTTTDRVWETCPGGWILVQSSVYMETCFCSDGEEVELGCW